MSKYYTWVAASLLVQAVSPAAYYVISSFVVPCIVVECVWSHGRPLLVHVVYAAIATVLCIGLAMSVCLHRYFAHSAFRTSRALQFLLGIFGCLAFQGDPLWWAIMHQRHHKHCDVKGDPHSSTRDGVFYAVVGWMANPCNYRLIQEDYQTIDARTCVLEIHALRYLYPLVHILAFAITEQYAGYSTMVYCVLLPMWLARFITLLFNHEFHQAESKGKLSCMANNATRWLAIAVGESQHADHHKHPRRAHRPELDPPWHATIRWLSATGLCWDCRCY